MPGANKIRLKQLWHIC